MTEILFVLTTIFVAYVAQSVYNSPQSNDSPPTPSAQPEPAGPITQRSSPVTASITPAKAVQPATLAKANKPRPTKATAKPPKPMLASAPQPLAKGTVRDPKSGDVASISNNYRFTKRWIKDALVTEGLLDKVYKNNELNPESEALIKAAMTQLGSMEKYQG